MFVVGCEDGGACARVELEQIEFSHVQFGNIILLAKVPQKAVDVLEPGCRVEVMSCAAPNALRAI